MIPKRIFFFWGNNKMSWMRYLTLKSFRELNPDWGMILYVTDCTRKTKPWQDGVQQDFFIYDGPDYFNKVQDLNIEIIEYKSEIENIGASHLSNFLKWDKLHKHGGIYSDMDILWVRPLDDLYKELHSADTAICITKYLSIGLLGASISNRMFGDYYVHAKTNYNPNYYQCVGVNNIYDLVYGHNAFLASGDINWGYIAQQHILSDIHDKWPDLKIYNIPFATIYPFTCTEMQEVFIMNHELPMHTIGLHWYAGDGLSQEWNNKLHPEVFPIVENTFTRYARRYV